MPPPAQVIRVVIPFLPPPPPLGQDDPDKWVTAISDVSTYTLVHQARDYLGQEHQARREKPQNDASHQRNAYHPQETMRDHQHREITDSGRRPHPLANITNERPCGPPTFRTTRRRTTTNRRYFERLPARLPTSRPTNDQIHTHQTAPQEYILGTGDAFDETDGHPVKRTDKATTQKNGHDTQCQHSPSM